MQVVCANCQLSFQAPEGATGLLCPICRSPLRPVEATAAGPAASAARQTIDWSGGTLDDLIALLSGPSWSARIEVLSPGLPEGAGKDDESIGEVHVIAGGVADAIYAGKSSHDSLDNLRGIIAKSTHFRVEPRLPNPSDGNLSSPGPEQGKLEERPLATLMRYCEDFVLTCGIEVWRGSENAKVDYRRGEIVGVTVGGIDAPERLAEVMKWAAGNYRLVVPKLHLPETAPKRTPTPAQPPAAIPAPAIPRATGPANRTIFGMPAIDVATLAAAAAKVSGSMSSSPGQTAAAVAVSSGAVATAPAPAAPSRSAAVPAPTSSAVRATAASEAVAVTSPPPSVPSPTPSSRQNVNRTIFGVAAPAGSASPAHEVGELKVRPSDAPSAPSTIDLDGEVPSPGLARPPATPAMARPAAALQRTTAAGGVPSAATLVSREDERTAPTRPAVRKELVPATETAVWTYVGVGFVFGLALLGVYRLVMVFAH